MAKSIRTSSCRRNVPNRSTGTGQQQQQIIPRKEIKISSSSSKLKSRFNLSQLLLLLLVIAGSFYFIINYILLLHIYNNRNNVNSLNMSIIKTNMNKNNAFELLHRNINTNQKTNTYGNEHQQSHEQQQSFSACLQWKDDNHRLIEWIAYHYYALNLRYLVIKVDKDSKTSPKHIAERWNNNDNNYNLNMTIVIWTDDDIKVDQDISLLSNNNNNNIVQLEIYRLTQKIFYKKCSHHLQETQTQSINNNNSHNNNNKTSSSSLWTAFIDIDEFITFKSSLFRKRKLPHAKQLEQEKFKEEIRNRMQRPGYILRALQEMKMKITSSTSTTEIGHNSSSFSNRSNANNDDKLSCILVNRRQIVAKEEHDEDENKNHSTKTIRKNSRNYDHPTSTTITDVNTYNNTSKTKNLKSNKTTIHNLMLFDTLRYKYLSVGNHGRPKSVINLNLKGPQEYDGEWNPHIVMKKLCDDESNTRDIKSKNALQESNLEILHYLGSWESSSYNREDDKRRLSQSNRSKYLAWSKIAYDTEGEMTHVMEPWLIGFTKLVGTTNAEYLLKDVGYIIPPPPTSLSSSSNLLTKS